MDEAPAECFESRDAAAVAFPCEPVAVPFEPVALDGEHQRRPREVEAESFDAMLHDFGFQLVRS